MQRDKDKAWLLVRACIIKLEYSVDSNHVNKSSKHSTSNILLVNILKVATIMVFVYTLVL